jgi:spore maturation protein SpmB
MNDSDPAPDPAEEPGFDLGYVPPPASAVAVSAAVSASSMRGDAYRVLARAYRPQSFAELIGQDAMVQTLGNAIKNDRLAHAFLMTGVRGVGKTSTARLIAKALNCIGPDGDGGPTIDPWEYAAIAPPLPKDGILTCRKWMPQAILALMIFAKLRMQCAMPAFQRATKSILLMKCICFPKPHSMGC